MKALSEKVAELEHAAAMFVFHFQELFEMDWEYTKACLEDIESFVNPTTPFKVEKCNNV